MLSQAKNEIELNAMLLPKLKSALDYVVQEILKENEKLIEQLVYGKYSSNIYNRTYEFKNAWEASSEMGGTKASGKFNYQPDKMKFETGVHSSLSSGNDFREYLAETIYEGLSGAIYEKGYAKNSSRFQNEAWANKRDVWEALNKQIGIRKIKQYFEEGMRKAGLNFSSHVASVKVTRYDEK